MSGTDKTGPTVEKTEHGGSAVQQAADNHAMRGMPAPQIGGAPSWVVMPGDLALPPNKAVTFIRFPSKWTDDPFTGSPMNDDNGDVMVDEITQKPMLWRQCIIWPINLAEKTAALGRSKLDPQMATSELCKQMIRAYDGKRADWTGETDRSIGKFYSDIGEKCRTLLERVFTQLHMLNTRETAYFLEDCVAVRSVGS